MSDEILEGYYSCRAACSRYRQWAFGTAPSEKSDPVAMQQAEYAAVQLVKAFKADQLKAIVMDPHDGKKKIIDAKNWSAGHWPERAMIHGQIYSFEDTALGQFNNRTPMVQASEFDAWLERQHRPPKLQSILPGNAPEWIDLNGAIDLWLKGMLPLALSARYCEPSGPPLTKEIVEMMDEAFNAAGREVRFGMKGVKKIHNEKFTTGPLDRIPSEYFRHRRTFRPQLNMIESHSNLQTEEQFAISREGGERNPDWVDVIVESKTYFPWLHGFLSNYHEGEIANGEMWPEESSFRLQRLGFPELHQYPSAEDFVQYAKAQVHWSLPMTIAWIASRDLREVARQTGEFCQQAGYWSDSRGPSQKRMGMIWTGAKNPSVAKLMLREAIVLPSESINGNENHLSVKQARLDLRRSLEGGKITAYAARDFASHAAIPPEEWIGLKIIEHGERDCLQQRNSIKMVYNDVRLSAAKVLDLWPVWPAPTVHIAIWDFALGKRNHDNNLAGRLVADFYRAFWQGEFGGLELSLVQDNPLVAGPDTFEKLSREHLAQAALGAPRFAELGPARVYEALASWNMADYAKVRESYRYYFIPETGIGSLESQGRGLCAPPDVLEVWLNKQTTPLAQPSLNATTQTPTQDRADETEVTQWLFSYVKGYSNEKAPPDKEKLYGAHQTQFKERAMLSRAFYRLRSRNGVLPRCWVKQGKRVAGWHSKLEPDWKTRLGIS